MKNWEDIKILLSNSVQYDGRSGHDELYNRTFTGMTDEQVVDELYHDIERIMNRYKGRDICVCYYPETATRISGGIKDAYMRLKFLDREKVAT